MKKCYLLLLVFIFFLPITPAYSKAVFNDIENHWAKKYIEILTTNPNLQDYSDKLFKPNQPLTRAEAVKIIVVTAEIQVTTNPPPDCFYNSPFIDVDQFAWYTQYLNRAYCHKLIEGYKINNKIYFYPYKPITRAEFLALTLKAFNYNSSKKSDKNIL